MRIVTITAFWRRPQVTNITFSSLAAQKARLAGEIDLVSVAAGSEGAWSKQFAERHGIIYTECQNRPLGRKWQHALTFARTLEPDAVMVVGSDNVMNDALFRAWAGQVTAGVEYSGLLDTHQYVPSINTLIYWPGYTGQRENEPIGPSRCFSRALLDRINWQLWDVTFDSSLDWSATLRLRTAQHTAQFRRMSEDTAIKHLGVKLNGALSPSLHTRPDVTRLNPHVLPEWFGDSGSQLLALSGSIS